MKQIDIDALRESCKRRDEIITRLLAKIDLMKDADRQRRLQLVLIGSLNAEIERKGEALRNVGEKLGYAEWSIPEHAEELLDEIIKSEVPKINKALQKKEESDDDRM